MKASEVIELLSMQPHPEGGWYAEVFRDEDHVSGRSVGTAIYYLLEAGQRSHWHSVDATEIWHFYKGAPLKLGIAAPNSNADYYVLGNDLLDRQRPQIIVPKHWWQSAECLGEWTLVGCTVSPGFQFSGFQMAEAGWMPSSDLNQ